MPIFRVDPTEVAAILALPIPPHATTFNGAEVRSLIANSLALDQDEKVGMLASLGDKTQVQVDALIRILRSEVEEMRAINEKTDTRLDDAMARHLRQQFKVV